MFQLSETEARRGEIQSQYKATIKAEHREIQMWGRERGSEVRKKQGDGGVTSELPSKKKTIELTLSSFAPGKHSCQML